MPFMTKKMGNTGTGYPEGYVEALELFNNLRRNVDVIHQDMESLPDEIISRIADQPKDNRTLEIILVVSNILLLILVSLLSFGVLP